MTPDCLDGLAVALLTIWFVATVAYQVWIAELLPVSRRYDIFRLLVCWRLFPGTRPELRLRYRDQDARGQVGLWQEIPLARSNRWHRSFWNPESVALDAAASWLGRFVVTLPGVAPERLMEKAPAKALWLLVNSQPWPVAHASRQFEVRSISRIAPLEERVLFTSDFQLATSQPYHDDV
ncbi:MAG: hypothetical protein EBT61_11985 [Verrucomicrobia bacterium]|nr:hypothetical protein [Verrucomicrobiota bacterium]